MYDKCQACGANIRNIDDCRLMQVGETVKTYCLSCFTGKTKPPKVEPIRN